MIKKKPLPAVHEHRRITPGGARREADKLVERVEKLRLELERIRDSDYAAKADLADALGDVERMASMIDDRIAILACRAHRSFGFRFMADRIEELIRRRNDG